MIPNKSNFKFQELTPITGVKPYVIRYWETEFPEIAPTTSDSGQKIYSRSDVEAILKVKKLLFEDKMTIPEAKMRMSTGAVELARVEVLESSIERPAKPASVRPLIQGALDLIREIKAKRNW